MEQPSMRKDQVVVLSEPERARLHTLIGQEPPRSAPSPTPASCSRPTRARPALAGPTGDRHRAGGPPHHVVRVRQQYANGGLEAAVDRKAPERQYRRKLDGEHEAHLVALTCSAPP